MCGYPPCAQRASGTSSRRIVSRDQEGVGESRTSCSSFSLQVKLHVRQKPQSNTASVLNSRQHWTGRPRFELPPAPGESLSSFRRCLQAQFEPPEPEARTSRRRCEVGHLAFHGGPSHLDLFDPKPTLEKLAGQPMPASSLVVPLRLWGQGRMRSCRHNGRSSSMARAASGFLTGIRRSPRMWTTLPSSARVGLTG